jgi:hypothetical protein
LSLSWQAFARGDWETALAMIAGRRRGFAEYYDKVKRHGFTTHRVRVVERPVTPYLQWEMHVLALRHEYGGLTRVIPAEQVASAEGGGPLPEVYTHGTTVMYEAVYDADGVLAGARRFVDTELIMTIQRFIAELYDEGEPLDSYFDREIKPLPPPAPKH